jgi:hypothetical protein
METTVAKEQPKVEVEAWECVICCGDGTRTGKVTLACSHETCLACFMKMTTTPTYYGTAPTELKCPFCRGAIRTVDGITEQEKVKIRMALVHVSNTTLEVKRIEDILTSAKTRQAIRQTDLAEVLRDLKLTEAEAREIVVITPTVVERPQAPAAVATAPLTPLANVPTINPTVERTKCPGCRSWRNSSLVRFRHVHDEDGTTRRLRRCDTCQDQARRNYEAAARARHAAIPE